ncbi:MAG: ribosome maturation factor RimP [Chitinophagia bacterium]|nr:ribosome maturation factor RimP [Chitinophagia bacterium]
MISLVESQLSDGLHYLVEVKIEEKAGKKKLQILIDSDQGVSIDYCASLSRALSEALEAKEYFGDAYLLEVSSPGVDEPLSMPRQYVKNIGRHVELETLDGRKLEGKLLAADETSIQLEEEKGKGKKKEIIQHFLLMKDIKSTIVKLIFK